jgi:hypothetical protein
VDYQVGAASCPTCGSNDQVQTARELFDTMNAARDNAFQRLSQFQRPGQAQGQSGNQGQFPNPPQSGNQGQFPDPSQYGSQAQSGNPGQFPDPSQYGSQAQSGNPGQFPEPPQSGNSGGDDYDHYNAEAPGSGSNYWRNRRRGDGPDFDFDLGDSLPDEIGGAIAAVALGFAGRALGKRLKRAFEEKVMPAVEARTSQAQQQWEQSKSEQDAIVERYPELRACLKDKVVFVDGGYRTVPMSELKAPVTLAQADDVVSRLR